MSDVEAQKKVKKSKKHAVPSAEAVVEPVAEGSEPTERHSLPKKSKSKSKRSAEDAEADNEVDGPVESSHGAKERAAGEEVAAEGEEEDVPALSHKALRLAKRRKLAGLDPLPPPTPPTANSLPPPAKGRASAALPTPVGGIAVGNTPAKTAHGIWVGNLSFKTSSKMLLDWFEDRGLKEVLRINMPGGRKPGEMNKGFAYVDFPTVTDQEIAVGLSEDHLDGRKLLIKPSDDFTGRPLPDPSSTTTSSFLPSELSKTAKKILGSQKNPVGPTLFLGNLGFETTVEEIRTMFDAHQKAAAVWNKKGKGEEGVEGAEEGDNDEEKEYGSDDEEESDEEEDQDAELNSDPDSDLDEDVDEDGEKAKKKKSKKKGEKGPKDLSKALLAGIRKIRLGTFEDTGKCKGWAFVDFHLPAQCSRALVNPRNHTLNGRKLIVEFASAEAVRRGQVGTKSAVGGRGGGRGGRGGNRSEGGSRGGRTGGDFVSDDATRKRARDWDDAVDGGEDEGFTKRQYGAPSDRGGRGGRGGARGGARGGMGRGGATTGRAKPGMALATAQRGSEAIVESTGKKITF